MRENLNEEKILHTLSKVDPQYILEAAPAKKQKAANGWTRWTVLAACLCLVFSGILACRGVYRDYKRETSYISIDVNPSLEFCLNSQNKVVKVCAYNEDGQKVADCLDVKNRHYKEAIKILLDNKTFSAYLKEGSDLTFTIVSDDEEEIIAGIEEYAGYCEANQEILCANYETRQEAYANHCSTGKYRAFQELAAYDETVTLEECQGMSMHELHERIKECERQGHSQDQQSTDDGTNGGHGHHGWNHH